MKLAITTQSNDINAPLDERFGRAGGFIIFDLDNESLSFVDNNQNLDAPQGAGIQAAKTIINAGVGAIITGNVGPKAFRVLHSAGVDIFLTRHCSVQDAVDKYRAGQLDKVSEPNVEGHWQAR